MTEKRKRIKITIDKALLIAIIQTAKDGETLDDRLNALMKKGLEAEGKL
jgi:hypothetical protein